MKKFFTFIAASFFIQSTVFAENFNLTLEEAINLALQNNRSIEQAAADVDIAKWNLSIARRSTGINFSWESNFNRIGGRYYERDRLYHDVYGGDEYPAYTFENYNSFSLSMPVYSGGGLEAQRNAAKFQLQAADSSLTDTKQQIAWRVAQAFYQVLQYKDIINVREEEINNLNTHLQTVQIQYEVGTVALADVLSTNVQIANSKQALNSARANFQNAVANLNNIIGLPVDTPLNIDEDFDFVPFDKSEAECIEFALNNRPDAKAAALNVKSYQENISQAKAGYRPRVNLYVQKYFSGENLFKDNHNADRWSAGLQMSWNIFDNNVTAAQVQQAKAQLKKSESAASQILDEVKLDVHNAYTNLAVARLNISITQDAVKQAQEQYLIAQVRYEEGVDTNLIVMDAQEKLTQAKTNFFTALYSYNTSRAQLFKAMGTFEIERGAGVPNPQ